MRLCRVGSLHQSRNHSTMHLRKRLPMIHALNRTCLQIKAFAILYRQLQVLRTVHKSPINPQTNSHPCRRSKAPYLSTRPRNLLGNHRRRSVPSI